MNCLERIYPPYNSILMFKMEENKQHFWHIMLYYFKKSKNATETHKKRFLQCMEEVLWLIERVRSGLQRFVLEIFHWTLLVDQWNWSNQNQDINWEQSHSIMQEIVNILKISKSILVKRKNVSFILQKKINRLFGQPIDY